MLTKIFRTIALLSLTIVFPLLSQAVTITNASGEQIYKVEFQSADPALGGNCDVPRNVINIMSTIANQETVGYVIPNDQKICIEIVMKGTGNPNYKFGPISGEKCAVKVFENSLGGPKLSAGCVCTNEDPSSCPRTGTGTYVPDPIGYGLTMKNMDNREHPIDVFMTTNAVPDETHNGVHEWDRPGSCWGNEGDVLWTEGKVSYDPPPMNYQMKIATGYRDTASPRRICIVAHVTLVKYALNPVHDVPECHIEFFRIEDGKGEPGQLRATPECGYTGRCPDGDPYTEREACLPESN